MAAGSCVALTLVVFYYSFINAQGHFHREDLSVLRVYGPNRIRGFRAPAPRIEPVAFPFWGGSDSDELSEQTWRTYATCQGSVHLSSFPQWKCATSHKRETRPVARSGGDLWPQTLVDAYLCRSGAASCIDDLPVSSPLGVGELGITGLRPKGHHSLRENNIFIGL